MKCKAGLWIKKFRILVTGFWAWRHGFIASNCWTFITFITAVKPVAVVNVLMMTLWLCHRSVWVTGSVLGTGCGNRALYTGRIYQRWFCRDASPNADTREFGLITREKWHEAKDPEDSFLSDCRNKVQRSDGTDVPAARKKCKQVFLTKTHKDKITLKKNIKKDGRAS